MGNQSTSQDQVYHDWQKYYTLKSLPGSPTLVAEGNVLEGQEYELTANQIRIAYQRSNINQSYCNTSKCLSKASLRQSQQYQLRKKQTENVVKVLNFKFGPSCYDFINDQVNFLIITERIHCRLKDLDGITRKQGFYILYQALKGYSTIAGAGKLGFINSQMIGLTTSVDVRVWINSCWAINYPQKPLASQRQDWMIDEVVFVIEQQVRKTNKNGFGQKFASHYALSKKKFISMITWLSLFTINQQNQKLIKQSLKKKIQNCYQKLQQKEVCDNKILLKAKKIIDLDDRIEVHSYNIGCKSTGYETKKTYNNNDILSDFHKIKKISVAQRKNQTERISTKPINYRQNLINQIKKNKSNDVDVNKFQSNKVVYQQQTIISNPSYSKQQKPMKICFNFFNPPSVRQRQNKIKFLRKNPLESHIYPLLNSETTVTTTILPNSSMNSFNQQQAYVEKKMINSKHSLQHDSKQSFMSQLSLSHKNSHELQNSPQKKAQQKQQPTPQFDKQFQPFQFNKKQKVQQGLRFTFSSDKNITSSIINHCLTHSPSQKDLIDHIPVKQQQPTAQLQEKITTQQYLRDFRYYLEAYHPQQSEQSHVISDCQQDKSLTVIYQSSEMDELHN